MTAFWLLLLFVASTVLVLRAWRARNKAAGPTYPLGLEPYPLIGHLPQFFANRHRTLDCMADALGRQTTTSCTFVLRWPGGVRGVVTANPANVEHVLRVRFDRYPKGARVTTSLLHDFLGRGIFNADGDPWRAQRKVASHEFSTRSLRAFVASTVHAELHGRLLPLLRRSAGPLDLQNVLERFAFDNICRVAFDHDPHQLPDADDGSDDDHAVADSSFADAFREAANLSAGRFRYAAAPWFWKVKRALDVGSEKRLRKSVATVHDFADRIIRSRLDQMRSSADGFDEKHDLLSRFMASQEGNETEVPLRDVVISFLIAGQDTTSSALSWFFWLLSSRPDVQRRIRDEVAAVRADRRRRRRATHGDVDVDNNSVIGFDVDELREMHYVHAAITEAMRLYPPVPVTSLEAEADDVLPDGGTAVEAGWFVVCSSYAMGRMESVWGDDAREYRPERWLNGEDGTFRPDSPFRFAAFHAGPRMCLGKEMAYVQMKSIVACVLEELQVSVDEAYVPRPVAALTLRMADGLPVTVKPRRE